eukprot:CAMPEP_0197874276 /NCGR_PEP_ID=MMETSP1439-20131203/3839_1 /TAXON_ID=66791 /ORGANISM="Gonyaulax spinifera, Strain CCMP409" /LENGTH=739 /DNA_ID=CAMNT_0043493375 /DNA_START=48 /DNA_END=2267 /DNA_ORIENTATION=+
MAPHRMAARFLRAPGCILLASLLAAVDASRAAVTIDDEPPSEGTQASLIHRHALLESNSSSVELLTDDGVVTANSGNVDLVTADGSAGLASPSEEEAIGKSLVKETPKLPQADYDKTKDMISSGVSSALAAAKFGKDPNLKTGGELISSIGAVVAVAVPPPAGLIIGGALALTGGVMAIFAPAEPTTADLINGLKEVVLGRFDDLEKAVARVHSTTTIILSYTEQIYDHISLGKEKLVKIDARYVEGLGRVQDVTTSTPQGHEAVVKSMKEFFIRQKTKFASLEYSAEAFLPANLANIIAFSIDKTSGSPWGAALAYQNFITTRTKLWVLVFLGIVYEAGSITSTAVRHTQHLEAQLKEYSEVLKQGVTFTDKLGKYAGALTEPFHVEMADLATMTDTDLALCTQADGKVSTMLHGIKPSECRSRYVRQLLQNPDLALVRDKCGAVGKSLVEKLVHSSLLTPEFWHPFDFYYGRNWLHHITDCKPDVDVVVSKDWALGRHDLVTSHTGLHSAFAFALSRGNLHRVSESKDEVWSTGWSTSSIVVGDGRDGVFVVSHSNGVLYHATSTARSGTSWSTGWLATAMAPDMKGGIFIISRGNLYHVTPNDRSPTAAWSTGWAPSGMVHDGNDGVFIISRGNLYQVTPQRRNPGDGDIWSRGWADFVAMAGDGKDGLFIVSRGNLYHLNKHKKNPADKDIWSSSWAPDWMQHDNNGGIFIWSRGNLRRVWDKKRDGSEPWKVSS